MSQLSILMTSNFCNYSADELKITHLPFVKDIGKGKNKRRSFWQVTPNGNYGDECTIGKQYALDAIQYISTKNFPALLTWAVMEMPREENRTGIEVGFLHTISEFAMKRI